MWTALKTTLSSDGKRDGEWLSECSFAVFGMRYKYSLWKMAEYPHKKTMKELEVLMKKKESKKETKTKDYNKEFC